MTNPASFARVVSGLPGTPVTGAFVRTTPAAVLAQSLQRGQGLQAIQFSERPNRFSRSHLPTLYVAQDLDTACCEFAGDPVICKARSTLTRLPMLTFPVRVVSQTFLDLTAPVVLSALQTNPDELTAPWRHLSTPASAAPTQLLGEAIWKDGRFQGILYWSAIAWRAGKQRRCAAIFKERLSNTAWIEITDQTGRWRERYPPGGSL